MHPANCQILVSETKVSDCGRMRVGRHMTYPDDRVLRFDPRPGTEGCTAWQTGFIEKAHARELALAILAYLDGPEVTK